MHLRGTGYAFAAALMFGGLIVSLHNETPPAISAAVGSVEEAQKQDFSSLDS